MFGAEATVIVGRTLPCAGCHDLAAGCRRLAGGDNRGQGTTASMCTPSVAVDVRPPYAAFRAPLAPPIVPVDGTPL